jgi:hypothetical protein|tara:strand:+ start:434 stop:679 length:246 start_codon:yes stop_codon:yes gene_type:complete
MQTKEALNTIPIQKFIQQVKVADSGQHKEIKMSIQEAKNLMFSMSTLLANNQGRLEQLIVDNKTTGEETVTISMDGGSGWK